MQLRCANGILFGVLVRAGTGVLEVKCRSRRCGHRQGVVVLHRFDLATGQEVEGSPKHYRDPAYDKKEDSSPCHSQ